MNCYYNILRLIAFTIISLMCSICAEAQIVYQNGKINIGGAAEYSNYGININGMNGLHWTETGSRFFQINIDGNFPSIAGNNNQIAFYNPATNVYNNVLVGVMLQPITNVASTSATQPINDGLSTILNLRPVSGNLNQNEEEVQYTNYGFVGEEIEQILPEVVYSDENNNKLIDYNAIIPLLVSSVQELQATVVEQSAIIDKLMRGDADEAQGQIISVSPNPTHGNITIKYTLTEKTDNAYFLLANLTGKAEKKINDICGSESVSADLSMLNKGIHILSLVVNGVSVDTKQIILE